MSVYAQLAVGQIQDGHVTKQTSDDLLTISSEAKRLAELADSALKISRMSGSDETPTKNTAPTLNVGAVVRQICHLFSSMSTQRGRALRINIPEDLPIIRCDADSLTRILWNVLDNALKHAEHGNITVSASIKDDFVNISIKDEGIGISDEQLAHVFERGVTGSENGTGLGLALCRQMAQRYGGNITLESELGMGTEAIISLSINNEEEQ
jgi:signal transduction histidine kinase